MGHFYPSKRVPEEHIRALHLVLLQTALVNHLIALLLERNDDQSHEDVDEKKWEDHKIHHVEHGHLHPVPPTRPHVLLCHVGRMLQDPGGKHELAQTGLGWFQADGQNRCSLWPALSSGDGEECEESPADIVVVKLVSPPLSPLYFLLVSGVINVEASEGNKEELCLICSIVIPPSYSLKFKLNWS